MDAALIAIAIPIFFALIGLEHVVAKRRREKVYVFADSIGDLSCGIGEQVLATYLQVLFLAPYAWVVDHVAPWKLPEDRWWTWVLAFVAVDLAYYWFHRASHRVNFLWAQHKVHHQSEEYNLAVALRQEMLMEVGGGFLFYLPLAALGVPLLPFVLGKTVDTLYQFWIHTRLVKKLPAPIEWVLNTPSHHRVHHGINPEYIDKNYAGVFMWDRLFGSFVQETREPAYGTVVPLRSFDAIWANVEPFWELIREAQRTRRFVDKVRVFFAPPEWKPADLGGPVTIPEASRETQVKYAVVAPPGVPRLVRAELAVVGLVVGALLLFRDQLGPWRSLPIVLWVLAATSIWAALLRGAKRARELAALHAGLVPAVALVALPPGAVYVPGLAAAAAVGLGLVAWVVALGRAATPEKATARA